MTCKRMARTIETTWDGRVVCDTMCGRRDIAADTTAAKFEDANCPDCLAMRGNDYPGEYRGRPETGRGARKGPNWERLARRAHNN